VFSQAILHSAWQNDDAVSRKAYIMSWTAASVPGFLETSRITAMKKYHEDLRLSLARPYKPERAHIISSVFKHGISEYGHKGGEYWEEMLLPDNGTTPSAAKL
jgi:hypothetical protein